MLLNRATNMRRSSAQSNFFSSLKQVEKRLKLEGLNQSNPSNPFPETNPNTPESLGSPIYIQTGEFRFANTNNTNSEQTSQPPQAFISSSSQYPLTHDHEEPPQREPPDSPGRGEATDDIETLMRLLGLPERLKKTQLEEREKIDSCKCEGGFYEKIAGVKGPKCEAEVERMDHWIRHFLENGKEPYRLALLLLGKAAFQDDSGGLEFPSAINGFLRNDPPED